MVLDTLIVWETAKTFVTDELGQSRAMLHMHFGMAMFVGFTLALRRPPNSLVPLLLVVLLEGANELLDFARYHVSGWPWKPGPTVQDIFDTLVWPVLLTLAGWWRRTQPRSWDAVPDTEPDTGRP